MEIRVRKNGNNTEGFLGDNGRLKEKRAVKVKGLGFSSRNEKEIEKGKGKGKKGNRETHLQRAGRKLKGTQTGGKKLNPPLVKPTEKKPSNLKEKTWKPGGR